MLEASVQTIQSLQGEAMAVYACLLGLLNHLRCINQPHDLVLVTNTPNRLFPSSPISDSCTATFPTVTPGHSV